MKRILLSSSAVWVALSVCGQGNVNFANVGVGLGSPFFDQSDAGTRITGGTWTVELLAGPDFMNLVLAGPAFTGAFTNGFFNAGQRTVSNVTGATAFARVRLWDNMGGTVTSYEQATLMGAALRWGATQIFTVNLTVPPAPPATMVNMPSISVGAIPEPSTVALGLLAGLGALLFRRRE